MPPDVPAADAEGKAQQEGDAPARRVEEVVAHPAREGRAEAGGEGERHGDARGLGGPEQAAPPGRGVLEQQRGGAAELAARREPLHEAQHGEQDRREQPDRGERGQRAEQRRRTGHGEDDDGQHPLPPPLVAEMTEDDRAHRAQDERRAEDGQRGEQAGQPVGIGEERLRENGREVPVDGEVVPLHEVSDGSRDDRSGLAGPLCLHRFSFDGRTGATIARGADAGRSMLVTRSSQSSHDLV